MGPLAVQYFCLPHRWHVSGVDDLAATTIALEANCTTIFGRYERRRARGADTGFRLGRTRLALLGSSRDGREACDKSGLCLWGCHRQQFIPRVSISRH
jgi:hypothetical protein